VPLCAALPWLVFESALAQPITPIATNAPQPKLVIMDKSLSADQAQKTVHAAKGFYEFWNTGDPQFVRVALATNFMQQLGIVLP